MTRTTMTLWTLVAAGALLTGCGGKSVTPYQEWTPENAKGPVAHWQRSQLFYQPMVITDESTWKEVQKRMDREYQEVDFKKYSIVGAFALEPDVPETIDGKMENRGYGVWLKSMKRTADDVLIIRLKSRTATFPESAVGPLHFYFAKVDRLVKAPIFYINSEKKEVSLPPAVAQAQSTPAEPNSDGRPDLSKYNVRNNAPTDGYVKKNRQSTLKQMQETYGQ
ncbi:hypothetical protein JXA32_14325 [Candidatus Sumerlaeota bacterium]|nr:hypothetical protein [Candidatus Sumerlaeota bacterium]